MLIWGSLKKGIEGYFVFVESKLSPKPYPLMNEISALSKKLQAETGFPPVQGKIYSTIFSHGH